MVNLGTSRGVEAVKSSAWKRSIVIGGHNRRVSLEDPFWNSLKDIARERGMTVAALVAEIDGNRQHANLSSAIRLFVLGVYRDRLSLKQAEVTQGIGGRPPL
jgi:predicted DNA-binding ribbon-helix-helix protein